MAGMPHGVVRRAKDILARLEGEQIDVEQIHGLEEEAAAQTPVALDQECVNSPESVQAERDAGSDSTAPQLDLFPQANGPFTDELKEMNLSQVTPLQALLKLNEWQEMLRDRR